MTDNYKSFLLVPVLTERARKVDDAKHKVLNNIIYSMKHGIFHSLPETLPIMDILRCQTELIPLLCVQYGYLGTLKYLNDNGYNIHCVNDDNDNALLLACNTGNLEIIKYLLEVGFDINYANKYNENAFIFAVSSNIELIRFLDAKNIKTDSQSIENINALHYCLHSDDINIIKYLIEEKGLNINDKTDDMVDLLTRACYFNCNNIIEYIISKIKEPNLFGCYYWTLIHNNKKTWELLNKYYEMTPEKFKLLKIHELNLFQNLTSLFIFVNFKQFSSLMRQYNGVQKWGLLNYLESISDLTHLTKNKINTFMVLISSGNLQLIDYYRNKYNYSLTQRTESYNDLYTLAICNYNHKLVKYMAMLGLEMDYININYINHKKNRYFYDIYLLYLNYFKNINLLMYDPNDRIIYKIQLNEIKHSVLKSQSNYKHDSHNWYKPYIVNTFKYEDLETECAICRDDIHHMDDIIMCQNNHIYHASCLLVSVNNSGTKSLDCFLCFQKCLARSSNLYLWFHKPDVDYLNQRQKNKEDNIQQLKYIENNSYNKDYIYPIIIKPDQYSYMISDLSVSYGQDIIETNKCSYNLCYTTEYDVNNYIQTAISNIESKKDYSKMNNNTNLCGYMDVRWFNLYKSLHLNEEDAYDDGNGGTVYGSEEITQLIEQINQNAETDINQEDEIITEDDIIEDDMEDEMEDDIIEDEMEDDIEDDMEDDIIENEMEDGEYIDGSYFDKVGHNVIENIIIDENEPVYGEISVNSPYEKIKFMLNNVYTKHMVRNYIVNKYILSLN